MRKPRQLKKNAYYHVCNKFHRIVQIIMCDRIKKYLLALIHAAAEKFKMKIKNICILDTHFHMEIQPGEDENLSEMRVENTDILNFHFKLFRCCVD